MKKIKTSILLGILLTLTSTQAHAKNYIVLFKQGVEKSDQVQASLQEINALQVKQLETFLKVTGPSQSTPQPAPVGSPKVQGLWVISGAIARLDETDVEKLSKESWVEAVMEDQYREWLEPQDSNEVYATYRDLFRAGSLWGLGAIKALPARSKFGVSGKGVRVGILDTGIQGKHTEFAYTKSLVFKDFVNGLKYSYDDHGHGTHVAGTIAGRRVGVAPEATLVVGKMLSAGGWGYDSWILKSMQWMADPDGDPQTQDQPHLVSNSWGSNLPRGTVDIRWVLPYYRAIQTWVDLNIIPVFAAGNSGRSPNGFPGGLPNVISVGAFDFLGNVAGFSSRGNNSWLIDGQVVNVPKPDFSLPGAAVGSSTARNDYAVWSGTSMATPHLSGIIALLLQAKPELKVEQVRSLLKSVADGGGEHNIYSGYGQVDVMSLLRKAKTQSE